PVWQAGSAQRALKIGCTSAPKLTVGARATQRQSSLHSSFASQPPASHSSPSAESIEASPQRGAAKVTGTALAARSTPRITSHLASIVARSRTLVGPHVFRGQAATTVRPFRVGRRRTCSDLWAACRGMCARIRSPAVSTFRTAAALLAVALAGRVNAQTSDAFRKKTFVEQISADPFAGAGGSEADTQVEPWIAIDPNDAATVVAVFQQGRFNTNGAS